MTTNKKADNKDENKQTYWKGFKARFTGNSEFFLGATFFEVELLEKPLTGALRLTRNSPEAA